MTNTYPSHLYSLHLLLLFSLPSWKNPCLAYVLSSDSEAVCFLSQCPRSKGSDHPRLAVWNSQPQTTSQQGCNQRIQSSNSCLHAQLFQAFFLPPLISNIPSSNILSVPDHISSIKESKVVMQELSQGPPRQPSQSHILPKTQTPALSCWGDSLSPDRHRTD